MQKRLGKPIKINGQNKHFTKKILGMCNTDIRMCYQCQACFNTCPFVAAMDIPPPAVLRLVLLGAQHELLHSSTIWTCVGCNTCSTICPMNVDMGSVMDALRETAIDYGITPAEPDVLGFHEEILQSIKRHGRTHKLEIMMRYKLRNRDLFSDMDIGLKMLAKRKLDLMPSTVKNLKIVRRLFDPYI